MKKQFSALLVSRGLSSLIQAVSLLLFIRWAGIEAFGAIAVITSIAAVVYTFADWGATIHIPRSRARGHKDLVVGGLTVSAVGNSIAAVVLTSGALLVALSGELNFWLVLIPVALAVEQFTEAGLTVSVADQVKRVVFISLLVRRLSMLAAFLGLYAVTREPILAYSVASLVSAVSGAVHLLNDLKERLQGRQKVKLQWRLWKEFSPYVLENISASVRHFDTTIVAAVTSAQSTGLYSAAFRLTKPLHQIGGAATAVLVPHAARSSVVGVKRAAIKLCLAGALGVGLAVIVGLFSDEIVALLFGDNSAGAGPVFAWALISVVPVCLAPSLGGLLQGSGHQKFVAKNGVFFGVITILGVLLGAIFLGISGAAAALTIAYFLKSAVLAVRILRLGVGDTGEVKVEGKELDISAQL